MRRYLVLLPIVAAIIPASLVHADRAEQGRTASSTARIIQTGPTGPGGSARPAGGAVSEGRQISEVLPPGSLRPVLVEFRSRPLLDRRGPGPLANVQADQTQFLADLSRIEALALPVAESRVTRRFSLLFSGAAVVVDDAVRAQLERLPYVLAVHDDHEVRATLTQSVPLIGAPTVWASYGATGTGVKVAIIDSGIDYTHPDLGGGFGAGMKVAGGWDFVNNDADPKDDYGHGTHVAGIVAANGTVKGVAPGATLLAYKVLDASGSGLESNVMAALERAVQDGAQVANMSLGRTTGSPDDPASIAVDNASAAGMLCVIAAGNSGPGYQTMGVPGVARSALTVGATDKSDHIASYSSRGPVDSGSGTFLIKPEIAAPGSSITSTLPGNTWGAKDGTSMAAPHVAGAAALVRQARPALTPAQVKTLLTGSSKALALDALTQGAGRLDVLAAFQATVLIETPSVNFGLISEVVPTTRQQDVVVRNVSASSQTLTLSIVGSMPAGVQISVSPSNLTLVAGATSQVHVSATIDPANTPDKSDWPFAYEARLRVDAAPASAVSVPVMFLKGPHINLTFDASPSEFGFYNPVTGVQQKLLSAVSPTVQLLPAGTWDVYASWGTRIVIKSATASSQGAPVEMRMSDATVKVAIVPTDEQHQVLTEPVDTGVVWGYGRLNATPLRTFATSGVWNFTELWFSPMGTEYGIEVGAVAHAKTTNRFFSYVLWKSGLASNQTVPQVDATFRRLVTDFVPPLQPAGYWYRGIGLTEYPGCECGWIVRVPMPMTSGAVSYLQNDVPSVKGSTRFYITDVVGATNFQSIGPLLFPRQDSSIDAAWVGPSSAYTWQPIWTIPAAADRWPMDMGPWYLPVELDVAPAGFINLFSSESVVSGGSGWATQPGYSSQSHDETTWADGEAIFDLYSGASLIATYTASQLYGGSSVWPPKGAYRLVSRPYSYPLSRNSAAQPLTIGTTRTTLTFDSTKSDPNPPAVSRLRIEQAGRRTDAPIGRADIRMQVQDVIGPLWGTRFGPILKSMTIEWRPNGTSTWAALQVTQQGTEYRTSLTQSGPIDLRVTAVDPSDNNVVEEWTPAFIGSVPVAFTDDPLIVGSTAIKAIHVVELRQAVDTLRARFGLGAFSWTDTLVAGSARIKATHLAELRTALSAVYAAAGRAAPTYTHASLIGAATAIAAVDVEELRAAILVVW